MTILLNNKFVNETDAVVPIDDAGLLYGYGVYETLRTFRGVPKLLDEHLERLEASAKSLFITIPLSAQDMKTRISELLTRRQAEDPGVDFKLRITVTAGRKDIRGGDMVRPTWFVTAQPLDTSDEIPISFQSYKMTRQLPGVKSTAMLPAIVGQHYALSKGADEALLVDEDGRVHEGAFSNVYLVKSDTLFIPDSGALPGITQNLIRKLAEHLLPIKDAPLSLQDFYIADEVFTSGSVRGVVAIDTIDGRVIEAPGPFTQKIQKLYQGWTSTI